MSEFEEELIQLIADHMLNGATCETLISAMELQVMALKETEAEEQS